MDFRPRHGAASAAMRFWLAVALPMTFALGLAGCGGGGSGGGGTGAEPAVPTDGQVLISGTAVNDVVANGTVRLETLGGFLLATSVTDSGGSFSIQSTETDIANGYRLSVTGGQVRGQPFLGELRASYATDESRSAANITLLTTLISRLADLETSGTPLQRRNLVIQRLGDLLAIDASQWSAIEPEGVILENLRRAIAEGGFDDALDMVAAQIHAEALSEGLLEFFPNMFGGVDGLVFGDEKNRISDFAGGSDEVEVQLLATTDDPYRFVLESGPTWLGVDPDTGTITYAIPDGDAIGETSPFTVRVINNRTGRARTFQAAIFVMERKTLSEGVVGPEGGSVTHATSGVAIYVEAGVVSLPTQFRIFRGLDVEGAIVLSVRVDGDTDADYELQLPDPNAFNITPAGSKASPIEQHSLVKPFSSSPLSSGVSAASIDLSDPTPELLTSRQNWYVKKTNKRLPYGRTIFTSGDSDFKIMTGWELWGPRGSAVGEPVLFIHGYNKLNGLGGGCCKKSSTWHNFTPLMAEVTVSGASYQPYEFRWRSDVRFQDIAVDLSTAVQRISSDTGRQVHIIAHSFGGIVVRSFLQGLGSLDVSHIVAKVASATMVGTPHSGVFGGSGGNREGTALPNGRDSLFISQCGQISCYQMGVSVPNLKRQNAEVLLGLDPEPGYISQRLAETYFNLPDIPIQILIGLTSEKLTSRSRSGDSEVESYVAQSGDGLISFAGQRFLPHLGDSSPLIETQTYSGLRVQERLLGYPDKNPQVVPGTSVGGSDSDDLWLHPTYRLGYRHTDRSSRGSAPQVALGCTSLECNHDVWLKTKEVLAEVAAAPIASPPEPADGLLAHWPFNGNSSDISGNGRHGIVHGAVPAEDRFGRSGRALSFNGTSDYVSVPHDAAFNLVGDYAFSLWFYQRSADSNGQRLINKITSGSCGGWNLDTYDGSTGRKIRMNVGCPWVNADRLHDLNTWNHVVVSVSNSIARIYLNGEPNGGGSVGTTPVNSLEVLIGRSTMNHHFFDGVIDDLRLYGRALSFEEVLELYQSSVVDTNALLAHYSFDEGEGLVVRDSWGGRDFVSSVADIWANPGIVGTSLDVSGRADVAVTRAPDSAFSVPAGTEISLSAWVQRAGGGSRQAILSRGRNTLGEPSLVWFITSDDRVAFSYCPVSPNLCNSWNSQEPVPHTGGWEHFAITYTYGTGQTLRAFRNGRALSGGWVIGSGNVTPANENRGLRIGNQLDANNNVISALKGQIDEVRIWKGRTLNPSEVRMLYMNP